MKNYKIYTTSNIITYKDGEISFEIKSMITSNSKEHLEKISAVVNI